MTAPMQYMKAYRFRVKSKNHHKIHTTPEIKVNTFKLNAGFLFRILYFILPLYLQLFVPVERES